MDTGGAPAFDEAWLDRLASVLDDHRAGSSGLLDLYLERRVERRLLRTSAGLEEIEVRDDGCALRRRTEDGLSLEAANGIDRTVLATLLADIVPSRILPPHPLGAAPPTVPQAWSQWAEAVANRPGAATVTVHFIARTAAVVRPGRWVTVRTPPLVRVAAKDPRPTAVLAVWDPGGLDPLLEAPARPHPHTGWLPEPGTRQPVVFTRGSGSVLIHELIGHMAESDLVATGLSPLSGRTGERIASHTLTVVDDPTLPDLPGSFDADDEGVSASPVTLLTGGVLTGWLCDGTGARKLGASPGRGRRAGWQHPPIARMSNLVTAPGPHDPAELEASITRGLLVTRSGAAMVNPGQRRFVLRIEEGWELLHGRRRRPLAPFHLTGDILGTLAGIRPEIGNDPAPDRNTGWCHKDGHTLPTGALTPTLVVDGLEVL